MSDALALVFILLACLTFSRLCGIRNELKRIADLCERAEKRTQGVLK